MKRRYLPALMLVVAVMLSGCGVLEMFGSPAKQYTSYVQSVMDTSYKGVFDTYMDLSDSTEEEAAAIYDATIQYHVNNFYYNAEIDENYLTDEIEQGYYDLFKSFCNQAQYTVYEAEEYGDGYCVKVEITPMDLYSLCNDIVYEEMISFNEKYEAAAELTEDTLFVLESEYAKNILDRVSAAASSISTLSPVSKIAEIEVDENNVYGVADTFWQEIDDLLFSYTEQ